MSDPHHPPAPAGGGSKKMNPFAILLLIVLGSFALAFGAQTLYGAKTEITWTWEFFMRVAIIGVIIGGIAQAVFKK